ncbi:binding-protein-dependent transport systems inner membrane component [Bifidobacterium lemurum]|uniref:Binding-protein-dependent transport systems inner membrane component n=1 Tax=Bifidobacterium lemurum TaxID=1603886 RepID=A0A261FTD2_9BIFI|nr:ABC transporter permease [Bifidobacterium lemurum]OZG62419.1 binding-protein-dependent transport systems inner membrane component [Bifidobacterium lemurum]QOL33769.1 ABC transporter permease [Bifidobacterium lemurum]
MLRIGAAWLSTVALLLWWFLATLSPADSRPLPSPLEVWQAGAQLVEQGMLLPSIGVSLARVLGGLALGLALAVPAGLVAGASRLGLTLIDKPIHMMRAIPFPALAPLFIVWFGIDETMKIALIAVGVFGLIYVNLRDGVRGVDPHLLELAQAYRLDRGTVLWRILFRGALPNFMTGLRFALTVAWIALVTCETVNSSIGLGYILSRSQQFSRTDQMVLCVVLYAALGLASEALVGVLERAVTPWKQSRA